MKRSSFIEGTVIATAAIVIVKILGMLYVIPFYATVGVMGSALYAYAYNIYVIFLDISSAGIPLAISKLVSEYNTLGKMDAKTRTFRIGRQMISFISVVVFVVLFLFAKQIATLILGDLTGGNTIESVTFVIRCISFAILVIPYLSVAKGYLQGHKIVTPSSVSQVIEQVVRIAVILLGSYLALNIFKMSLTNAVAIAVSGAFVGGLVALIYIRRKIQNNKQLLNLDVKHEKDDISNSEIRKKIVSYAIPMIIINTTAGIYNFVNMVFILRTMNYLNYPAAEVEFITTAITTWAPKINMIVGSLAMGMSVSLIPAIVTSFTLNNWKEVNEKLNKAWQMILVISLPMTIGISLLAKPIWSIFYGYNNVGTMILAVNIFTSLFINLYIITSSVLQGVNKFKLVYLSAILGFAINAILDIPLMLLFNKIGLQPFYGAVLATIIGYSVSLIIALYKLKKEHSLKYKDTYKLLEKLFIPLVSMIIIVIILKLLLPFNALSKTSCVLYVGIISLIGGLVYIFITQKSGIIDEVFGQDFMKKIIKKLTFKK